MVTHLRQAITAVVIALGEARLAYVAAALALYIASVAVVTVRWRIVLTALGAPVRFVDALFAYLGGVCAGNITPARTIGGDACRAGMVSLRAGTPLTTAGRSVVYDRLSEVPAVVALVIVALPTLRAMGAAAPRWLVLVGVGAAGAIGVRVIWRQANRSSAGRTWAVIGDRGPESAALQAIGCSFAVWLQDVIRIMLVAAAFHVTLTASQGATLSVLALLGGAIPIPGGVGAVEGGLIAGLVWFGTSLEVATAITLVERAISYACGTAAGAVAIAIGSAWPRRGAVPIAAAGLLALLLASAPARAQMASPPDWPAIIRLETALRANPTDLRLGADYRQLMIRCTQYDRAISFLKKLASEHRQIGNVHLSLALAYIDKIPVSGRIRQAFLGKDAIEELGESIRSQPTWIAYYMRGLVNLYYDRMFNRIRPAIGDFEQALALQRAAAKQPFHVRAFVALGDAYWKLGDLAHARAVWSDGLQEFPGDPALNGRLAKEGRDLYVLIEDSLDATKRQDTSLREMAQNP